MTKLSDNISSGKGNAKEVLEKSKTTAERSLKNSKLLASKAAAKSNETIDKNPLAIVLGGLALGAIIGALLPKTEREKKILGKAGKTLNDKVKVVASAAKSAGRDKIDSFGINSDSTREQFRDLVGKATEAVKAAGQAASDAARKRD